MARIGIGMRIRRMTEADIPAVSELEVQIYPEPWSVGVFHDELGQANRIYYVAEGNSGIGGYGGVMGAGGGCAHHHAGRLLRCT